MPSAATVVAFKSSVDLQTRFMDRPDRAYGAVPMTLTPKAVYRERKYFFIGADRREVIYSVTAPPLDDAWKDFQRSRCAHEGVIAVIKTETEIYPRA